MKGIWSFRRSQHRFTMHIDNIFLSIDNKTIGFRRWLWLHALVVCGCGRRFPFLEADEKVLPEYVSWMIFAMILRVSFGLYLIISAITFSGPGLLLFLSFAAIFNIFSSVNGSWSSTDAHSFWITSGLTKSFLMKSVMIVHLSFYVLAIIPSMLTISFLFSCLCMILSAS